MARRDLEPLRQTFFGDRFKYTEEEFQALKEQRQQAKLEEQSQLKEGLMKSILKTYHPEVMAKKQMEDFRKDLEDLANRHMKE